MKFEICICCPRGDEHIPSAFRFVNSYFESPPMCEHDTIILTDAGHEQAALELFGMLPGVRAVATPDHGKDLSRYEAWCHQTQAGCVLFLGGSAYCRRPGWGLRMITTFQRLGQMNIYGACGNTGAGPVNRHIRTTGFWGRPGLFAGYPHWPKNPTERYGAEHGSSCLTEWVIRNGGQAYVVTFQGEYLWPGWHDDPQGYARGSQQNLLIGDRLTAPPYQAFA